MKYFIIVVTGLFFNSIALASTWMDIGKNQGEIFFDFDSFTLLSSPKRVAYKYKIVTSVEIISNTVILCDSAKYYLDSLATYSLDGNILSFKDEDSPENIVLENTFQYAVYKKFC
ncbi:MAG: hypothetical protein EOO69_02980 [Moraxellaceae bacterium]|nr:MAG: hypothetical protein EOO69_02980 [Moraxellaceae bacterium]